MWSKGRGGRLIRGVLPAVAAVIGFGVLAQTGHAQLYEFELHPEKGSLGAQVDVSAPLAGTLIGNHDPVTNPGGTMTRPGLCCSSGNQPIPYSGTLVGGGPFNTNPAGLFSIDVDPVHLTADVGGLWIDVLKAAVPSFNTTINLTYSTFHTVNPSFVYVGVSGFPLPLGQVTVTSLTMTQTEGIAPGTLTPVPDSPGGNEYVLAASVDVVVAIEADFNGNPIDSSPVPLTLALDGTLTLGDATAWLTLDVSVAVNETDEGPFEPFVDIPLELPTLDEPAHVLMSGQIQSVTIALDVAGSLFASGQPTGPLCPPAPWNPADLTCDGVVDVFDLLMLLASWGPCDVCTPTTCPADLNGDCTIDVFDLLILLANWG